MDYLVVEGYKEAAENFAREAGMNPQMDFESIQNRMTIRNAIQAGDIVEAIERVNDLDPEVRSILFWNLFLHPSHIHPASFEANAFLATIITQCTTLSLCMALYSLLLLSALARVCWLQGSE
jgi:hypothetical protein